MNSFIQPNPKKLISCAESESSLHVHHDKKNSSYWFYMNAKPRHCFTPELLNELIFKHQYVLESVDVQYTILASKNKNFYNLGGDLEFFRERIKAKDREGLLIYAINCIDCIYRNNTNLDKNITSISLVKGKALGGGFEAALSSNILIAEYDVKMGFPEIIFNLFPGMGAYSLLLRKVGPLVAKKIISSGALYTAQELYDIGIVDVIVEKGQGEKAVYDYIKFENKSKNGLRAFRDARNHCHALDYEELISIANTWVEAALRLGCRDLRIMEKLASKQYSTGL